MHDKKNIECKNTKHKLARKDNEYIYLWCKRCNVEHPIPIAQLIEQTTK